MFKLLEVSMHAQETKGNMLITNEQTGNFRREFKTTKKKKDQIGILGWINMYIIYKNTGWA